MAVKSLVVQCDWCNSTAEVEFKGEDAEDSFFGAPLPDEDWFHLEGQGDEYDFCSRDCLFSHLS